jgi:YebC/PmpR family DNA-binding regulatory protein
MSGHSHFATIKRQKEAKDAAKGRVFSKMARAIAIAVKAGRSPDPDANYKLRMVIEQARASNMPKSNIERAISNAATSGNIEEITYEGYGPYGIGVVVETATDNKNRTSQEIKNIFERVGGSLAGPGAVSFNFEKKGVLAIKKSSDPQTQMLSLIDQGVEDISETADAIEAYVLPQMVDEIKDKLTSLGFEIESFGIELKPKSFVTIAEADKAKKAISFLNVLDDHEDVQNVYSNFDVPDEIAGQINQ